MDVASSHLGKVASEVKNAKDMAGTTDKHWSPSELEAIADKIDRNDETLSGMRNCTKPMGASAGFEGGINYTYC